MSNRYYIPEGETQKQRNKFRHRHVCAECGEGLSFWTDTPGGPVYLACHRHNVNKHEGIAKEFVPPSEIENLVRREDMSEENVNQHRELVAKGLPLRGLLTKEQATMILKTVWPGAPETEVIKAAILCRDFGLHPLMKHVYLIKYDRYSKQEDGSRKKVGEDWSTVLGIGATRLIMSRQGSFSYLDDTPRIMTEEEQKRIFGRVDPANVVAITKLCTKSGLQANGYGKYPRDSKPMGTDKGNSIENMAFIRSERNAVSRLYPDAMLPEVDVVDEQYMDRPSIKMVNTQTGEILKGETEEGEVIIPPNPPAPEVKPPPQDATEVQKERRPGPPFKNIGEFFGKAIAKHPEEKLTVESILFELGVKSKSDIGDLDEAWNKLEKNREEVTTP